jgi:hypothetical protein
MRLPEPSLTPVRAGLIMIAVVVLGVIFARVVVMSGQGEVRRDNAPETTGRVTQEIGGVKGLRGSLP